jgi:hypothetical protein
MIRGIFKQSSTRYTITASANPTGGGTVTGGGTYEGGQQCTVTATANTGYSFVNWTENGEVVTTNANYTFIVTGNRTLVANFTLNNYTISVTSDPAEGGMVTGAGNYVHGTTCTLTATANENYEFINWTKDGVEVSTEVTFTFIVTASETYVAHFNFDDYVIENASSCQIYPNPFTDEIHIMVSSEKWQTQELMVFDLLGRCLYSESLRLFDGVNQFTIQPDLPSGVYVMKIGNQVQRIVKY